MTLKFRVRAYIALELDITGGDESNQYLELGSECFLDSAAQQEIPVFLELLDKNGEGLNLPEIRRQLLKYGYPAEWWPEDEEDETPSQI